jgi:hypothetical protein
MPSSYFNSILNIFDDFSGLNCLYTTEWKDDYNLRIVRMWEKNVVVCYKIVSKHLFIITERNHKELKPVWPTSKPKKKKRKWLGSILLMFKIIIIIHSVRSEYVFILTPFLIISIKL